MKNKKASATIFILIALVLIVFFGLIVLYGIRNIEDNGEIKKEIILLNAEYGGNEVVNSLEEINYPEDNLELVKLSSSSSKSHSSKYSSNLKKSESSEIVEVAKIADVVKVDVEDVVDVADVVNVDVEDVVNVEVAKIADVEDVGDGEIFKIAGDSYIKRDEKTYKISEDAIGFNPSLPSKICEGEKIDITVTGRLMFTQQGQLACVMLGGGYFGIKITLLENDVLSDNVIATRYLSLHKKCDDLDDLYLSYKYVFEDVDLSSYFGGLEGNTIELYVTVEPTEGSRKERTYGASTFDSDVDLDKNCQCVSGACCSLSTKRFISSGSQPTGYTDENYCSGTNSPTGTDYVKKKDYYCDGKSSSVKTLISTKDTCGSCQYCREGYSICKNYDSSTILSGGKRCDGSGNSVNCKSQSEYKCSSWDVYWFDDCGNIGDKKQECGTSGYSGERYCFDNDVYQDYLDKGCFNNKCVTDTTKKKIEDCGFGCRTTPVGASCNDNPNIKCDSDKDCGESGYGNLFCYGGNVVKQYNGYVCKNPKTVDSFCDNNINIVNVEYCKYSCTNGKCNATSFDLPDLTATDLVVQSILDSPKSVILGFTVRNIGKAVAKNVYWKIDSSPSDRDPIRTTPITLEPGEFTRAYMQIFYSKSGTYNPKVIVDINNYVKESNESNNEATLSVIV